MSRARRFGAATAVSLSVALVACGDGCGGCGSDPVAELIQAEGEVTRDHSEQQEAWQTADVGDDFHLGDAVRTGSEAGAKVRLRNGGGIKLQPETVVRFLPQAPGDTRSRVAVELGSAEFEALRDELNLFAEFGHAVLGPGGRAIVNVQFGHTIVQAVDGDVSIIMDIGTAIVEEGGQLQFATDAEGRPILSVLVGQARFEREGEEVLIMVPGQEYMLAIGGAIVEQEPEEEVRPEPLVVEGGAITVVIRGSGVRLRLGNGEWTVLEDGSTQVVEAESAVSVPNGASVDVRRGTQYVVITGAAEAVLGASQRELVALQSGGFSAESGVVDVAVRVPGGTIIARGGAEGSRAEAQIARRGTTVSAERGTVTVQGENGSVDLQAPDEIELARAGGLDLTGRPPARAELMITAGESSTIHDPSDPTAVGVRFSGLCAEEGVVELGRRGSFQRPLMESRGVGRANIAVPTGSHRYRVRCVTDGTVDNDVKATGTLTVRRDTGQRVLPRVPGRTMVDDFSRRSWDILYQNHLPIVTLWWAEAPDTRSVTLHYQADGKPEQTISLSRARHRFDSGELEEGSYRVWFETPAATPNRSPPLTLRIRFDNATPVAQILRPAADTPITESPVEVAGVALDGYSVSVNDQDLPLDRQFRFRGEVPKPTDIDALAIRLSHRQRGVHYYLRAVGGTP